MERIKGIFIKENKLYSKFSTIIFVMFFLFLAYNNIYSISITNFVIDDFENLNINQNSLGQYCDIEIYNGNKWLGETGWAAKDGSGGLASIFSNTNTLSSFYYTYYTIISNSAGYRDFSDHYNNYAILWWMRNHDSPSGPFKLDIVELDAPDYANRAEVEFKNYNYYNLGSNEVTNSTYQEFFIPIADFTNQQPGFDFTQIKSLIFKTVTCQTSGWRMDDLMIIRGVQIRRTYISNITLNNTNRFVNKGDNIKLIVNERSNIYGLSGSIFLSNTLNSFTTNITLNEIKSGNNSYYYTNLNFLENGKYFVVSFLSNKYASDKKKNYYFYVGAGVKSIDSFVGNSSNENYLVGQQVIFKVIESNNFSDLTGFVRITNQNYSTNLILTNYNGGEYRALWNTSSLTSGTYYCDARLEGDNNGANNSGIDLIVKLSNINITISSFNSSVDDDTDGEYSIGSTILFKVKEEHLINNLLGKIIIKSLSQNYSNVISLNSEGNGIYTTLFDTSNLTAATDYKAEAILGDSKKFLSLKLYYSGEISYFSNVCYQKYENYAYIEIPKGSYPSSLKEKIDIIEINLNTEKYTLYGKIYKFLPENVIFSKLVRIGLPVPSNNNYALYRYNNGKWYKVYSRSRTISNKLYLETETYTTGIYAVFKDSNSLKRLNVSTSLLTLNGDGVNDYLSIIPPASISDILYIKIFTLNGEEIRDLNKMLYWDGKDKNGTEVKSGIYIIKVKTINNTYYKPITIINK